MTSSAVAHAWKEMAILLDPSIRIWVIFPISVINFCTNVIRHYASLIFKSKKKPTLKEIKLEEVIRRAQNLTDNAGFIPNEAFIVRREFFLHHNGGYLASLKPSSLQIGGNMMNDPSVMMDVMKANFVTILIMIVVGGWVNWAFSGFVVTRVPFPLTNIFKTMLQNSIVGVNLDPSWVSSISFYFLALFGMQDVVALFTGDTAASAMIMDVNSSGFPPMTDEKKLIDTQIESLSAFKHHYLLDELNVDWWCK